MHPTVRIARLSLLVVVVATTLRAQEGGRYEHYEVYDHDLLPRQEYAERRARVLQSLGDSSAMLVRAAEKRIRSRDVEFEFRQRNSLLYLTGVTEPSSALLLIPRGIRIGDTIVRELLFLAPRNPHSETWDGVRIGPKVAPRVTGVASARSYGDLSETMSTLVASIDTLYYDGWLMRSAEEPLTGET